MFGSDLAKRTLKTKWLNAYRLLELFFKIMLICVYSCLYAMEPPSKHEEIEPASDFLEGFVVIQQPESMSGVVQSEIVLRVDDQIMSGLIDTIRAGQLPTVKELLAAGALANFDGGHLPLIEAVKQDTGENNRMLIIYELLEWLDSDDINKPDYLGRTALYYAILKGKDEVANALRLHGAFGNTKAMWQEGLNDRLFQAVHRTGQNLVQISDLLNMGACPDFVDPETGYTTLTLAIMYRHPAIPLLLKHGADPNRLDNQGYPPLQLAIILAAFDNDEYMAGIVHLLLTNQLPACVNVLYNGLAPLHYAILGKQTELVAQLLQAGADPALKSAQGVTPSDLALHTQQLAILKLLKEVSPRECTVSSVSSGMIQFLSERMKPAIIDNNRDALEQLLDFGAVPYSSDLGIAIDLNRVDHFRLLLKYGADPLVPLANGFTPLLWVIRSNRPEMFKQLLTAHPGLVNYTDENGYTLLHWAVIYECPAIVIALLGHDASCLAQTAKGLSAVDLARKKNNKEILALIEPMARLQAASLSTGDALWGPNCTSTPFSPSITLVMPAVPESSSQRS